MFTMGKIVLASASPRRRELLQQVGIEPEIVPSQVEEVITRTQPDLVVMELSAQKAEDVAAGYAVSAGDVTEGKTCSACEPSVDVVIGADTVVAVDGKILGKPVSRQNAIEMLGMLQGREHQVYTGVTLVFCKTGERVTFAEKTDVWIYPMSRQQMEAYADTGEPMDKAGAYGIQGCFAAYVKGICGDYNNVVGLPVGRVYQEIVQRCTNI